METETQVETVTLRENAAWSHRLVLEQARPDEPASFLRRLDITKDQLQSIVQQAYDEHGIVAQLWTDAANDTPQTSCNGTDHCPASTSHHFDCQAVQG